MNIVVDEMLNKDINEVSQVFQASFNNLGETWTDETALAHVRKNFEGECHFVARADEKIIGFLLGASTTLEGGDMLFIDSIAVLPEYQRGEVGAALWDEAVKHAKSKHLHGLCLLARKSYASYQWYTDLGLSESGWIEMQKKF